MRVSNLVIILSLLVLTSCIKPPIMSPLIGPKCFTGAYNYNIYAKKTVSFNDIEANNYHWVDSGINLDFNQNFYVTPRGNISLCHFSKVMTLPESTFTGITTKFDDDTELDIISSDIAMDLEDLRSGGSENKNQLISIEIEGTHIPGTGENCYSKWRNYNRCLTEGEGLKVYIGNKMIGDYSNKKFPKIREYANDNNGNPMFPLPDSEFFRPSLNHRAGVMFICDDQGCPNGKFGIQYSDNYYSDNIGFYKLRITKPIARCSISNAYGDPNNNFNGAIEYLIQRTKPADTAQGELIVGNIALQASRSGNLWVRVRDDNHADNFGSYNITVDSLYLKAGAIGKFLNSVVKPVKEKISFASRIIYDNFKRDPRFNIMVKAMVMLYIILFGIFFMFGLVEVTQKEFVTRIAKIGIVLTLISENSWAIFNNYFLKLFTDGAENLIYQVTGTSPNSEAGVFSFVDYAINQFFAGEVWLRMAGLLLYGIGIILIIMFLWLMFKYIFIVLEVFIGYLMVIIALSLLISLAPLFLSLILFERTREYFKNWTKYLLNFALQPVIIFLALAVMNELIMGTFHNLFSMRICWQCLIDLKIDLSPLLSWLPIPINLSIPLPFCIAWWGLTDGTVFDMFALLLILMILISTLEGFIQIVPQITDFLTQVLPGGGTAQFGAGSFAGDTAQGAKEAVKGLVGQDKQSKHRRKDRAKNKEKVKDAKEKYLKEAGKGKDSDGGKGKDSDGGKGGNNGEQGEGGDGDSGSGANVSASDISAHLNVSTAKRMMGFDAMKAKSKKEPTSQNLERGNQNNKGNKPSAPSTLKKPRGNNEGQNE